MTMLDTQARILEIRSMIGLTTRPAATGSPADTGDLFDATLRSTLNDAASVTGTDVVSAASRYLGTPYVFGSNKPEGGLDCSGLVQRAYADLGVKLPRVARDQARVGTTVPSLAQARPGDLLAFGRPVDHIAIYLGDNRMIVAPHTGEVVKIEPVHATPSAIRRVLPSASSPASSPVPSPSATPLALRPAALTGNVPYADLFQQAGSRYGLSPTLLAAVAKVESGYNPNAVSRAGAQGLMQLMPATARGLGVDALNPQQAVDGAARVLSGHLKRFGSLELALAAYNAGGGAVQRYGGIPPFAETKAYVPKVKAAMDELASRGFR